jgi:hypothetical protein
VKIYDDLTKIPLSAFLDCYLDGKLESLCYEGSPENDLDKQVLASTWERVQEQFAMKMGNSEQRMFLKLLCEVNELTANINLASTLINTMAHSYHKILGNLLNRILKSDLKWPDAGRDEINHLLKRSTSMIKPLEMRKQIKQAALDVMEKKLGTNKRTPPTREYFDLLVNLIEEHFSVPVSYDITTSRFVDKLKRMDDQLRKRKFRK